TAVDIDAFTEAAVALNGEANDVYVDVTILDILDHRPPAEPRHDVILVGDLYARADRRSGPHLSAEGAAHAARGVFRAGDARAGGPGDQADDGMGAGTVAVIPGKRSATRDPYIADLAIHESVATWVPALAALGRDDRGDTHDIRRDQPSRHFHRRRGRLARGRGVLQRTWGPLG